ncbi:MAG: globin family protein [Ginsengibacter sp.]
MTKNNIELVKKSWAIVGTIEMQTVGGLFYNRLFEIMPEVKPMFNRTPLPEQSRKLLTMLAYIISKLDKLEDILDEVEKLAKRHTQYGVRDEHYTAVGSALLWTLQKGLGQHWNDELAIAWTEVYTTLSCAMMEASREEVEA